MPRFTPIIAFALLSVARADDQDLVTQSMALFFPSLSTDQRSSITQVLTQQCASSSNSNQMMAMPILRDLLNSTRYCTNSLSLTASNAHKCVDIVQDLFLKYIKLETLATFPYVIQAGDKEVVSECAKGNQYPAAMSLIVKYTTGCNYPAKWGELPDNDEYKGAIVKATQENGDLNSRGTRVALQGMCNVIEEFDGLMTNVIKFASRTVDAAFNMLGN